MQSSGDGLILAKIEGQLRDPQSSRRSHKCGRVKVANGQLQGRVSDELDGYFFIRRVQCTHFKGTYANQRLSKSVLEFEVYHAVVAAVPSALFK